MKKLSQTGVGTKTLASNETIRDSYGKALLPIQASGDGATTFRVRGRISTEAPWVDIVAAGTTDFLESISWCPLIQLEVTAGSGTVTLWVGEE
jgi:hypothetical protein